MPTHGMDDTTSLVVNCPVCHRTIWANSVCHHGQVPPPTNEKKPADEVTEEDRPSDYKGRGRKFKG